MHPCATGFSWVLLICERLACLLFVWAVQAEKEMKQADLKEIPTIEDVMLEEQDKNGNKGIVATLFSTSWIWK